MESKIKILILEHEPNDVELLQYEFKKCGLPYTAEVVQSRVDYEDALGRFTPDIILADYSLPSFDGLAAFRIRQHVSPETPFIFVSGTIGEEKAVEVIRMGVTDYVLKDKLYQITPKIHRALQESADRKQKEAAQQQLKRREEQLQKIMDLSPDVICTLDQQARFVTTGAACETMWGYLPEELVDRQVMDLVDQADRERTYQAIAALENGPDLIHFENHILHKSGARVFVSWSVRWDRQEKLAYCVARDVTDLKAAKEKVRDNEKRFQALLQNSSDGLTLLAADGTVLERSPSALKILGLEAGETSGKFRTDLIHPDDLFLVNQAFTQIKDHPDQMPTIEYRVAMPDGSYKWVETTLHNHLQEPSVRAMVLNFRDITESKLAEIALRASEARLKEAQAIGRFGFWEMNLADQSMVCSDEIYRNFGLETGQIEPSFEVFVSFIHPDDRAAVLAEFDRAGEVLSNGSLSYRIQHRNGEVRFVVSEWVFKLNQMGRPVGIFGILQDVTERRLTEIALEKSEEKYHSLFDLSPIPMWVYQVETLRFLDVNEAATRHYGYSKEEFLAMTLQDIRPREEKSKLEQLARSPKETRTNYAVPFKHIKKSGEVIDVDIKSSLVDLNGKAARLVIASDISERMKYIHAIEEQNARLREIAWVQSHVVRAPLARILGLITLLDRNTHGQVADWDPYNLPELLGFLSASAHELDGLIRDIVNKTEQEKERPILTGPPE